MSGEESILLKQIAKGSEKSFEKLYQQQASKLMALLVLMLRDKHLAEDVLQETMVSVWHHSDSFDESKSCATTWIFSIARHKALDRLRQKHRFDDVLTSDHRLISETLNNEAEQVRMEYGSGLMTSRLKKCLEHIGQDAAACIRLSYYRGFTHKEIALIRDKSVNTVKSWIRRGLTKLRECVQQ